MKKIVSLVCVVAAVMSLSIFMQSCGTINKNKNEINTLINGTWILKVLNGKAILPQGQAPSMTLDYDKKTIYGFGGCNRFTGMFKLSKGIFSAPHVGSTMMMCPDQNLESEYLAIFDKETELSTNGNLLVLKEGDQVVAEFTRGTDAGALSGSWNLQSVAGQDMAKLFPMAEKQPTIEFVTNDKMANGNLGCNSFRTTYVLSGSTISFGPILSTKIACPNLDGENLYSQLLSGESTLNVDGSTLTLSKDGQVVLTFKK